MKETPAQTNVGIKSEATLMDHTGLLHESCKEVVTEVVLIEKLDHVGLEGRSGSGSGSEGKMGDPSCATIFFSTRGKHNLVMGNTIAEEVGKSLEARGSNTTGLTQGAYAEGGRGPSLAPFKGKTDLDVSSSFIFNSCALLVPLVVSSLTNLLFASVWLLSSQ